MTRWVVRLCVGWFLVGCAASASPAQRAEVAAADDSAESQSIDAKTAPDEDVALSSDTGSTVPTDTSEASDASDANPQPQPDTPTTSSPEVSTPEPADTAPQDTQSSQRVDAGVPELTDVGSVDAGPADDCAGVVDWPKRILMIGNSYTGANGGLSKRLKSMMDAHPCAKGAVVSVGQHSPGGVKLHQHYVKATTAGSALHSLLNDAKGWDIIVLQDQSQIPGFPSQSPEKAKTIGLMDDWAVLIEKVGAKMVLFMTWGRRDGDTNNPGLYPDYTTMQNLLAEGYNTYAQTAQGAATQPVTVAPVGLAWQAVHDNMLMAAAPNAEAVQSRFQSLYSGDGSHPAINGTYLAAAVFLAHLTKAPVTLGPWLPNAIGPDDKVWLDSAANAAIKASSIGTGAP